MAGVFISYRRDDTAGYAGRLFADLVRHLGDAAVFMDVTDIAPGSDFVETIDRAVGSCDVLLVLIGRRWVSSADDQGRRRLDAQQDFIRHEVATALGRHIPVVPVLVQGASMPAAEELPESLRPLARRQAIELSDSRWDTDVARLAEAVAGRLESPGPSLGHVAAGGSQRPRLATRGVVAGVTAAAVVVVALIVWSASRQNVTNGSRAVPEVPEAGRTPAAASEPSAAQPTSTTVQGSAGTGTAYILKVPDVSTVRVGQQEFRILAVRLEPGSGDSDILSFLVRMTDRSEFGGNFWDSSFRLVLPEGRRPPVSGLNELLGPLAALDGEVRFEISRGLSTVELEISEGKDTTRLPVNLRDRKALSGDGSVNRFGIRKRPLLVNSVARLPISLPSGAEAMFPEVSYRVLSATVERYNVEKASFTVTLRCTTSRAGVVNFWDRSIRLLVDGVPRAPDESVNELVQAGASKDAPFVFLIEEMPETLVLTIRHRTTIEIPIDVSRIR